MLKANQFNIGVKMIELRNLSHGFLKKDLFSHVTLKLVNNERYGIVGANGSGKSTLLRMICNEMEPDDGEIFIESGRNYFRIGQDFKLDDEEKIIDTAMAGQSEIFLALEEKRKLLEKPTCEKNAHEIAKIEEFILQKDGYRLRSHSERILEGLGIPQSEHEKPLKNLSGGYKWRVFLAQALVKNPDILMLDEPTNHLDIISIRWLETFLQNYQGLILLVSHDKRFLDHVCTQILDVDFQTIKFYSGNYTAFEKARQLFIEQKEKENLGKQKEIDRKQAFVDRFRYKSSKARQAQSRLKQIEKIIVDEPTVTSRVHPSFTFVVSDKGSKEVLAVKHLSKSYGSQKIINDFSFNIQRGDKIAVIGANGTGKSTLIKALAQEFQECNDNISWGQGVNYGYFPQDCGAIIKKSRLSVLEWLWQFCADKPQSFVQGMLGRVLFQKDDVKKSTLDLSGGELGRLYLAYLMTMQPNVLLLDEPTNHLDIESIESLTEALKNYEGTLIVVSHDRSFIEKIAKRIFEVTTDTISDYLGTYSEFVSQNDRDYLDVISESALKKREEKSKKVSNKLSYEEQKKRRSQIQKLKKQVDRFMADASNIEEKIELIDQQLMDEKFYEENSHEKILELQNQKNALESELEKTMEHWEESEKQLHTLEAAS